MKLLLQKLHLKGVSLQMGIKQVPDRPDFNYKKNISRLFQLTRMYIIYILYVVIIVTLNVTCKRDKSVI